MKPTKKRKARAQLHFNREQKDTWNASFAKLRQRLALNVRHIIVAPKRNE